MCKDCGCTEGNHRSYFQFATPKIQPKTIKLETNVLAKNDKFAAGNRTQFENKKIRTINMMSSPGAGKTFLLEKTLSHLSRERVIAVITGDQEKSFDAKRLEGKGAYVKQLNTYSACHLDAEMISKELENIPTGTELLIIENVGNLVCPAAFDLGEHKKIALLSTTEGEDKPAKYPVLFHTADVIVITKTDLIPHLDWNLDKCREFIRAVNSKAVIIELSAKTGEGMEQWFNFLREA